MPSSVEHHRVAETLLEDAVRLQNDLDNVPAMKLERRLRVIDQLIAMAHVHARLAKH